MDKQLKERSSVPPQPLTEEEWQELLKAPPVEAQAYTYRAGRAKR